MSFPDRSGKLAAVRAGFQCGIELRHLRARPFFAASDMLFCLARFAAMSERHARRSSMFPVSGDAMPAVLSMAVRPADVAVIAVIAE